MPGQIDLEWLFILSGFVLGIGAFVLLAMLRTDRARSNAALVEFLGESAGGILLMALALEAFGILQLFKLFAPDELKIKSSYLWFTLLLFLIPAYGIYRARNFSETVRISSSQPSRSRHISSQDGTELAREDRPPIADEWQEKILEIMKSQSEGLSLVDMGEKLAVDWRQLTVAARQLVHDKKLRKEGKYYYKT
jgi:hypothetical protein